MVLDILILIVLFVLCCMTGGVINEIEKLKRAIVRMRGGNRRWHPIEIIINHKLKIKGVIMEANVKVDQTGLVVFDSPKDKYGNATTLNGELDFTSSDEEVASFAKATQEEIDAYNNDPATQEPDKIPADLAPYVGTFKSHGKVGTALLKVVGDPTAAEDDTPVEGTLTLHVGAGNASNFGTVSLKGVKDDADEN